jgi:hypothetical protein
MRPASTISSTGHCPIRFYEVPFYESPSAQEEVVATLERNEKVRAVLVASGLPSDRIDGVPNAARAPKVAKFLELNFQPFLNRNGVEWWLRRSSRKRGSAISRRESG